MIPVDPHLGMFGVRLNAVLEEVGRLVPIDTPYERVLDIQTKVREVGLVFMEEAAEGAFLNISSGIVQAHQDGQPVYEYQISLTSHMPWEQGGWLKLVMLRHPIDGNLHHGFLTPDRWVRNSIG